MIQGLSNIAAQAILKESGYNELPSAKPKKIWKIALEVMKEPMFMLLISCGLLYMLLGDYVEGAILLLAISVIIIITFYQYQKTEKALEALKRLSSLKANVVRDGVEYKIEARELVLGDIIVVNEGDRIAADAQLLQLNNLVVDESLLTGESIPVVKVIQSSDNQHLIFSGTLVVQGKGYAQITATGVHTQFGKIGTSLQNITQDSTRLQKEMKVLIRNLFIIGVLLSVGVVCAFYFTRGNFVKSLLTGLSAAMSLLPEEFPVVLTIFLALGSWRLSKNNVLTRKPSAIETLGSATVLCTDKTGTITENKMSVAALYVNDTIYQLNSFENHLPAIDNILKYAYLASQEASIDPMEKAMVEAYQQHFPSTVLPKNLVKEYPLSPSLLAMTRVFTIDNTWVAYAKGAPEAMFTLCTITEKEKEIYLNAVHQLAEQGYRVLAVGMSRMHANQLPESQSGFNFDFIGLIALEDPIRAAVPQAIQECATAGIKVMMITGDFPATAKSIATKIGFSSTEVLTGEEMQTMTEAELRSRIHSVSIFARVVPEQKLRIVQALKANNEIVAMTGDGVNDAPALKAADIGIAMGLKGTDVAREAASLVLLDDNFASIVAAIRSGRRIFDNLQKAMTYILAIHIPIIGLVLYPAFFSHIYMLLMPLHIVFLELIIDPVCSIAFEAEQEEKGIMTRPPRNPDKQFFGSKKILQSVLQGLLLLALVIGVYYFSVYEAHQEGEVRALTFTTLILGNLFLILTSLSKTRSFVQVIAEKNYILLTIILVATALLFVMMKVPFLQQLFSFQFPGYWHFLTAIAGALMILIILELIKWLKYR
ncbi:MAG: hypothetical protein RL060_802 [Bacteroidota bacterium]